MIYTVFSTRDSPYMQWQSELLEYSWKKVGQPEKQWSRKKVSLPGVWSPLMMLWLVKVPWSPMKALPRRDLWLQMKVP